MLQFQLSSWSENVVETHSFHRVSDVLPETLQKYAFSQKFNIRKLEDIAVLEDFAVFYVMKVSFNRIQL